MRLHAQTYVSIIELATAPRQVRDAVLRPESWLPAWRHVRELRVLADGDAGGIGRRYRTTVRAVTPYRLTWEMVVTESQPDVVAWDVTGDLEGTGRLDLIGRSSEDPRDAPTVTEVVSTWTVRPTPRWIAALWPFAQPLFIRNHDAVMRRGVQALADHLEATVTRCDVGIGADHRYDHQRER